MSRHFKYMVKLAERGRAIQLHHLLLNAVVTAGVCSRLNVPIRGRIFVRYADYADYTT
jgi:hypothetical protein